MKQFNEIKAIYDTFEKGGRTLLGEYGLGSGYTLQVYDCRKTGNIFMFGTPIVQIKFDGNKVKMFFSENGSTIPIKPQIICDINDNISIMKDKISDELFLTLQLH